jgi:hypothetical protein
VSAVDGLRSGLVAARHSKILDRHADLSFAIETEYKLFIPHQNGMKNLDCYLASARGVRPVFLHFGEVHLPHAAGAELAD